MAPTDTHGTFKVTVYVFDKFSAEGEPRAPVQGARVEARRLHDQAAAPLWGVTDRNGEYTFNLERGGYKFNTEVFGIPAFDDEVSVQGDRNVELLVEIDLNIETFVMENHGRVPCHDVEEGETVIARVSWSKKVFDTVQLHPSASQGKIAHPSEFKDHRNFGREYQLTTDEAIGTLTFYASLEGGDTKVFAQHAISVIRATRPPRDVSVTMRRAGTDITDDIALWAVIRKSSEAMSFNNYFRFINSVLCGIPSDERRPRIAEFEALKARRFLPFTDTDAYRLLKVATEAFVMVNCGVQVDGWDGGIARLDDDDANYVSRRIGQRPDNLEQLWREYVVRINGTKDVTLPYLALIRSKLADLPIKSSLFGDAEDTVEGEACFGILRRKLTRPCFMELIWSYWHEEGMLVQTINAIARRFQNIRSPRENDPLANLEIDPIRPLNSLIWGYIQDEQHRLSITRRAYEYLHEYSLTLEGKAVGEVKAADVRSRFLSAFHQLLHQCALFYGSDDNTTVVADGFPILNALKEVHLLLSEGAGNQFGGVPSTARIEMLTQLWLLARPEFREYLPTRIMVAYPEPWMDRVDAMKKLQGWTDASVLHFSNLGTFGERILLGIRFGAWSTINDATQAANWARFWRPDIQGYIHAYRSVTGADLTTKQVGTRIEASLPSVLLRQQLADQKRKVA